MEASNDKKRKKRKTRRCLDELRKKTHEPNDVCNVNNNTDAKLLNNKSNCMKKNYLTSNRLTLFNKAVRSETVTRCEVSKLEGKNFDLQDRQSFTSNLRTKRTNILSENNNDNAVELEIQNQHTIEDEMEIFSPNFNDGNLENKIESPKSIILFSPERENEAINSDLVSPLETSPISSSPSTINPIAKIMDGIDNYIKQNYPQFLTINFKDMAKSKIERVIARNRKIYDSLSPDVLAFYNRPYVPLQHNLDDIQYSWSYHCDDLSPNVLYDSPYSSPVSIIQNSKDDIDYSWNQYCRCESSGMDRSSPMDRTSSSSMSIESHSTSPIVSGIYDTPEYTFYPHKLN